MADGTEVSGTTERWTRFLRTRFAMTASVVLLFAMVLILGVDVARPLLLVIGTAVIVAVSIASLLIPWHRLPRFSQATMPVLDIVGVAMLAAALSGTIDSVVMLVVFPAVWLGVAFGTGGAVVGIVGAFAASAATVLAAPSDETAARWTSALIVSVVVAVIVWAATLTVTAARAANAASEAAVVDAERASAALRSFFEHVDAGLLYLDERGEAVLFNNAIVAYGELARHAEGDNAGSRVYAADQVTPLSADDQPLARMARGESFADLLYWIGPRGGQRALVANGRPIERADGRAAGAILVVQDVTELLQSNRAREDALATLAHELRTPLTSIVGYSELLLADDLTDAASARVEVISRNAEHLLSLSASFLDDLHGEVPLTRERIPLARVVDDALAVMETVPGFVDRELLLDVAPDLWVLADPRGIAEVLINLLGNAVKFSRAGGRISITSGEDDASVWLDVTNTGSHIDREDLERIFDRFYRGGNAQRGAVAGTGLGLAVSRPIVAAHGGTLTAEDVDDGATFRLCLPRY
ncbi:sensor histidine kinase [Microbacterium hatanonis]|uniref:histidine kinase n=1 Tax=Microbacterium hatanonis TaxID=404366 RepID=A0A5C8HZ97_9MICO|nr:PAS domain-containing sensor histidine kinase [Microbacterium hatanonis]TXK10371.1 PAS domain-containing protein [Microbacterium hatanonis]